MKTTRRSGCQPWTQKPAADCGYPLWFGRGNKRCLVFLSRISSPPSNEESDGISPCAASAAYYFFGPPFFFPPPWETAMHSQAYSLPLCPLPVSVHSPSRPSVRRQLPPGSAQINPNDPAGAVARAQLSTGGSRANNWPKPTRLSIRAAPLCSPQPLCCPEKTLGNNMIAMANTGIATTRIRFNFDILRIP